jgi:hypothetical protein
MKSDSKPPPTWQTVFLGIALPMRYLKITPASRSGPIHFLRGFGLYCLLPMVLLHAYAIAAEQQSPDAWRFGDFNPKTVAFAMPFQILTGGLAIAIFAPCMRAAMNALGLPAKSLERKQHRAATEDFRTAGWYIGTALLCLYGWWFAISIFFLSIDGWNRAVEDATGFTLLATCLIGLRTLVSGYAGNSIDPDVGFDFSVLMRSFFGSILGLVFWFIAMIPIGFLLNLVIKPIIFAAMR